jgi:predicted ribosomally synthesized peptide with SipW-like signal peptide
MKKTGFLVMALLLALGGLGIGYAAWTDTVTVTGNVTTGTLDLQIKDTSNTLVCKIENAGDLGCGPECKIVHYWDSNVVSCGGPIIAYADADWAGGTAPPSPLPGDDVVLIRYWNLFPCVNFTGDFLLHYTGTIPVKVELANISCTNSLLNNCLDVEYWESNAAGDNVTEVTDAIMGKQLHNCDYILVRVIIHIPQDDAYKSLTGDLTGTIKVKQWNEVQ